MNLSTKARYGSRFMVDLAMHYGNGLVPLKDIAQRQGISEKYLWNLVAPLKTLSLIRSARGSSGGFTLAKAPSEINMKEIVCALEGSLCLAECVENPSVCSRVEICATRDLWSDISGKIIQTLESVTLQDMVEKRERKESPHPAYAI